MVQMDFVDLALILVGGTAAVVALVYFVDLWVAGRRGRCPRCGAVVADREAPCNVCEATLPGPAQEDQPTGPRTRSPPEPTHDPDVGVLNPGFSPWMVKWALGFMAVGLLVRGLGMLEPVGVDVGVPVSLMNLLTVVGGVVAFLGFVVLDLA